MSNSTQFVFKEMNRLGDNGEPFLFLLDFDGQQAQVFPLKNLENSTKILFDINGVTNATPLSKKAVSKDESLVFNKKPLSFIEYKKKFDYVAHQIQRGNSFLVNLTQATPIETNLSLREIFDRTSAKYKLLLDKQFVVFSPETFVKIAENGVISSFPMKGTIDAAVENAEQILLADPKEQAEHNTIVDLIRNDLSQVAVGVRVERFRYVDRLEALGKTLLQVSSKITGQLPTDFTAHLGDIFQKLTPAGSICGAPKPKTLDIIRSVEGYERGFYTGIVGIFDGKTVDSGVMIRFIEQIPPQSSRRREVGQLVFKSGGGITAMSDAAAEYAELIAKIYLPIVK